MNDVAMMEIPEYKCHKQVWALKISTAEVMDSDGGGFIEFEDSRFSGRAVLPEYMEKHNPVSGGYYVVYEGGYTSFSPADAFESGYHSLSDDPERQLTYALKKAYRFAVGDPGTTSEQTANALCDAICNLIGPDAFCEWQKTTAY